MMKLSLSRLPVDDVAPWLKDQKRKKLYLVKSVRPGEQDLVLTHSEYAYVTFADCMARCEEKTNEHVGHNCHYVPSELYVNGTVRFSKT